MDSSGYYVNERAAQIIRFAGFLIPIVLLFFGILIHIGAINSKTYAGPYIMYGTMVIWSLLAVHQYIRPCNTHPKMKVVLTAYHVLAAIFILFVSGFATPFSSIWVVLLLASYIYDNRRGLYASILVFVATGISDVILQLAHPDSVTADLLAIIGTLIVGFVSVFLFQSQEIDKRELVRSHQGEVLQRDRLLTLVNNLADAIISTDKNGVIKVYNAASLNILDTNKNLDGKKIDDIVSLQTEDGKKVKLSHVLKQAKSVVSHDDWQATIGGEVVRLSTIYSPIRRPDSHPDAIGQDGYIIIFRDITRQKSLEEERDEFISVVSHELRTPITVAEGSLGNVLFMMDRTDVPRTTMQATVQAAHEQIIFLARMVNDLSTLSRAERGVADTPEIIDVQQLIHEIYTEYAPEAQQKKLSFDLELQPGLGTVNASRLYLKELLQNFVTNAIKYTKEGGITVIVTTYSDETLQFSVKDTGIGISKVDQKKIFDKFFRSEDYRTRETGGTGLGLYVAVKLAKKIGTTIELKSRLNHGSEFSFRLKRG